MTDHGLTRRLAPDPANVDILVWVGDRLWPREMAKVSVFDSTVQVRGMGWGGVLYFSGRVLGVEGGNQVE